MNTERAARELAKAASVAKCHQLVTPERRIPPNGYKHRRTGSAPSVHYRGYATPSASLPRLLMASAQVAKSVTIVTLPNKATARELSKTEPSGHAGVMKPLPPEVSTMVDTAPPSRQLSKAARVAKGHRLVTSERRVHPNGQKAPPPG